MSAIEILDDAGKRVVIIIAIEGPVIAAFEIIDAGLARLPTGGCPKPQAWPCHVDRRFTVIVPGGLERADGLMLLAVANKASNVHERPAPITPNHTPVPSPQRNDVAQSAIFL